MLHLYSLMSISLRASLSWQRISHTGTHRLVCVGGHQLASLGHSECPYDPEWDFISTGGKQPQAVLRPGMSSAGHLIHSVALLLTPALQLWCCHWSISKEGVGECVIHISWILCILSSEAQHPARETQTYCSAVNWVEVSVFCAIRDDVYVYLIFPTALEGGLLYH